MTVLSSRHALLGFGLLLAVRVDFGSAALRGLANTGRFDFGPSGGGGGSGGMKPMATMEAMTMGPGSLNTSPPTTSKPTLAAPTRAPVDNTVSGPTSTKPEKKKKDKKKKKMKKESEQMMMKDDKKKRSAGDDNKKKEKDVEKDPEKNRSANDEDKKTMMKKKLSSTRADETTSPTQKTGMIMMMKDNTASPTRRQKRKMMMQMRSSIVQLTSSKGTPGKGKSKGYDQGKGQGYDESVYYPPGLYAESPPQYVPPPYNVPPPYEPYPGDGSYSNDPALYPQVPDYSVGKGVVYPTGKGYYPTYPTGKSKAKGKGKGGFPEGKGYYPQGKGVIIGKGKGGASKFGKGKGIITGTLVGFPDNICIPFNPAVPIPIGGYVGMYLLLITRVVRNTIANTVSFFIRRVWLRSFATGLWFPARAITGLFACGSPGCHASVGSTTVSTSTNDTRHTRTIGHDGCPATSCFYHFAYYCRAPLYHRSAHHGK